MNMRRDAMVAAAHFILAVNRIVRSEAGTHVGTVGRIEAEPGAPNVIPGRVKLSLELRDLSMDKIQSLFLSIEEEAKKISGETGTTFQFEPVDAFAEPALTAPWIRDSIEKSAKELGLSVLRMPSGAGHDAQEIAKIGPIGMIFVPSLDGISHSPKEFTENEDVMNGANVLLLTLLKIDGCASR
jgi:N-carbamoyl-L-amino-acid hydrolase